MESNLQNKLQEFTAEPPKGVWEKIANVLDEHQPFAQRLLQYEEPPPAASWNKIEKDLAASVPAKVVPFTVRFKRPLRYAAAACFLAVILVTITLTVRRTEAGAIDPGSNTTVPTNMASAPSGQKSNTAQAIASSERNKAKNNTDRSTTDSTISSADDKAPGQNLIYSSLNEYVFFNDGDGKRRRVSKKLVNLVRCGDSDVACQQRLKQLRQRLAANAMTTDFTGILEMMRQLQ